jgi:cytochrome c biogenesis protein CcmG, thiol:disulfide interchange protein DsbE
MTGRGQLAIAVGAVGVVLALLIAGRRILGNELSPLGVGVQAPNFTALTLDSVPQSKSLDAYRGEVIMVNIWATWCAPCRVEMPSIEQLHRRLAPQGLKVVAVSVDDPGTDEQIRDFVKQYGLTFEILHDPRGQEGEVSRIYQTTGYPETVIIGRDGIIRKKLIGATDWNSPENRGLVERLLAEKAE